MTSLIIKYKTFEGEISERQISDIKTETQDSIDAFCHVRNERRSFKIGNISQAIDADTGELVENIWKYLGMELAPDGREILLSITAKYLSAIKALKFFSLITRGFSFRERSHLVLFIQTHTISDDYSSEEVDSWLQQLWCGNIYSYKDGNTNEYFQLLDSIALVIKLECKVVALNIARGSGRRPILKEVLDQIELDFGVGTR